MKEIKEGEGGCARSRYSIVRTHLRQLRGALTYTRGCGVLKCGAVTGSTFVGDTPNNTELGRVRKARSKRCGADFT